MVKRYMRRKSMKTKIKNKTFFLIIISFVAFCFAYNCNSLSALQRAAKENDTARLKELIDSGSNVNEQDGCFTPLVIAAYSNNFDAVKFLLEKKANPNLRTKECELIYSSYKMRKSGFTPLQEVSDLKIAKILIDSGVNPNIAGYVQYNQRYLDDYTYMTPLKFAMDNMNIELIEFYLKQNLNLKNYDKDGLNIYKKKLEFFKTANPQFYNSVAKLFIGKDISDLTINKEIVAAAEKIEMDSYTNIFTKQPTKLPLAITEKLKESKTYFAPVTYDSGQDVYFHYSEFAWDQNKQNLWEWYIIRNSKLNQK